MKYALFFYFAFFTALTDTFGQEPNFKRITTENGLPTSCVYQIFQDRLGNIWIASGLGISKYDGEKITNYSVEGIDFSGSVYNIIEGPTGELYFIGGRVLSTTHYNPLEDQVELLKFDKSTYSNRNLKNMASIIVDSEKNFNFGFSMNDGYAKVSNKGVIEFYNDTIKKGIEIKTEEDNLFYCSYGGENVISINGKTMDYDNQKSMHLNAVHMKDNIIALGDNKQLSIFKDGVPIINKQFDKIIIALNVDKHNRLWVNLYGGGTKCFSFQDRDMVLDFHLLKNNSVSTVLEDHEGGYWFSTLESGLFYTPNINLLYFGKESKLKDQQILGITDNENDEVITIQSENTITIFKSDTIYKRLDLSKTITSPDNFIRKIIRDSLNDRYFILTYKFICYLKNDTIIRLEKNITGEDLLPDKEGDGFWWGSKSHLYHTRNDSVDKSYALNDFKLKYLAYDLNGDVILIGPTHSLKKIDQQTSEISPLKLDLNHKEEIIKIQNIKDSLLIMYGITGTYFMTKTDTSFLKKEENHFYFVCATLGKWNELFMASNRGLKKLTFENDTIICQEFSQEIGLSHNDQKYSCEQAGKLWSTTNGGLYVIPMKGIVSTIPSAPFIKSIRSLDSSYMLPKEEIIYTSDKNNLTFELQAITFKYKDAYTFEYQLDQFGPEFRSLGGNELNLTNLDYGDYTLNYRIKTYNNIYSPTASFSFTILTPFWATWWFISLLVIAGLGLLFLIGRSIIRRIVTREKKKSEMKELIHSLRLQSIQSQFNPHFTFNAISSIQHHMSASTVEDAKTYLGMFSAIMRAILINSEKETILISEEVKLLETYLKLEQLRFGEKLTYEFKLDKAVDSEYDRIPPMIIQPLLENSINYGLFNKDDGGHITITFNTVDDVLTCIIEDNGIGREATREIQKRKKMNGSGKGLKLVQERLSVANQRITDYFEIIDLFDENGQASGTRIILKIELND